MLVRRPSACWSPAAPRGSARAWRAAFSKPALTSSITGVSGAEVAGRGRDPLLGSAGANVLDVRDGVAIKALVARQDSLDVVVNCAGVIRRGDELDPDGFQSVVDINLNGTMRICAAARPLLARSSGAIVNLASMLSFFGGGLVPGLRGQQGRHRATDKVAGHRLCRRRHSRQRHRARLDRHTAYVGTAGRRGAQPGS